MMKTLGSGILLCALSMPLQAQSQPVVLDEGQDFSVRAVGFLSGQQFAAKKTFDAVFGESFEKFFGGGILLAEHGVFLEVDLSRFTRTGQRAYIFNGQAYRLNIPLTVTLTPIEISGGYRFRRQSAVVPYVGVGIGSYSYKETSSGADTGEDIDVRHHGYLALGGAEFRVHRWVGIGADVQYTHIPGILGSGGLSKDVSETDLGGIAIRAKVIVGVGR